MPQDLHQEIENVTDPEIARILRGILLVEQRLAERVTSLEKKIDGLDAKIDVVARQGFPGGDPEGHRRAHEAMIETLAEKRRLRMAIQEKTISGLVWAVVVGVSVALWEWIKSMVRATT